MKFGQQADLARVEIPRNDNKEYLHTLVAGALLPFWQALISGAIAFVAALIIMLAIRSSEPFLSTGIVAVLVLAAVWLAAQWRWFTLTAERMTGVDLNRDGVIGDARRAEPRREVRVRLQDTRNGRYSEQVQDYPASMEQLQRLAIGILKLDAPFTVRRWCSEVDGGEKVFTQAEFQELRSAFLKARTLDNKPLLAAASKARAQKGYEFTDEGRQVLEAFLPK
jgi:hypothetical protein